MLAASRRMGLRVVVCWGIVLLAAVSSAYGIATLAERMAPSHPGSSQIFWNIACRVTLHSEKKLCCGGNAYYVNDSWFAYESSYLHGSKLLLISAAEVSSDFDAAVEALQTAHEQGEDDAFIRGYVSWRDDEHHSHTPRALLDSIRISREKSLCEENTAMLAHFLIDEQMFWRRLARVNWYWANVVFEWVFLSGLVLFALWPGIRKLSALRWAVHVGLLPVMFMLPTYLGYASYSFTTVGPCGGILYPFLLTGLHGGSVTEFDSLLLAALPKVLVPLSTSFGSPMVFSGRGMPGPTSAVIAGICLAALILVVNLGVRQWIKRRSGHGFG